MDYTRSAVCEFVVWYGCPATLSRPDAVVAGTKNTDVVGERGKGCSVTDVCSRVFVLFTSLPERRLPHPFALIPVCVCVHFVVFPSVPLVTLNTGK